MSLNPQCSINKNKDSCRPYVLSITFLFLVKVYLLMKSRLKPLQATCRRHTDKQVTQFSSHCHTNLHKQRVRRTPPGHCFRLPCPFSPQGFVPSDYQQTLESAHCPLDTALRAQLTLLRLTAKPTRFCKQMFCKRNSLNVGIYSLFCVSQSWRNHSM